MTRERGEHTVSADAEWPRLNAANIETIKEVILAVFDDLEPGGVDWAEFERLCRESGRTTAMNRA